MCSLIGFWFSFNKGAVCFECYYLEDIFIDTFWADVTTNDFIVDEFLSKATKKPSIYWILDH
jgi:hypothetical protein